nr:hypothetical protein [Tanacetum cinerariifolium]
MEQKRVFMGMSRSRVPIIQILDKAVKSPRTYHGKERKKTSPTVPSDVSGPARNPLNGPGQP